MKNRNIVSWSVIAAIMLFIVGFLTLRPVPIVPEKELLVLTGKVVEITEGGVKDVTFKIAGSDEIFYVNRGLERGLNLSELQGSLINEDVILKYPDHSSLLNFDKKSIHISKVEHEGKVVFSEIQ